MKRMKVKTVKKSGHIVSSRVVSTITRKTSGMFRHVPSKESAVLKESSMAIEEAAPRGALSPVSVRFGQQDASMLEFLKVRARAQRRSISDALKYYAHLGMIATDNPDLPMSMIEGILEAREELKAGLGTPYEWGVLR